MNGAGSNFGQPQQLSIASRKASYQDNLISAHAWTQQQHPNGFTYYWNSVTNSTAWGLPPEMKKAIARTTVATPVSTGRELNLGGGYIQATPQQTAQNPPAPVQQNNGFSNLSQPSIQVAQLTQAEPQQASQTMNFHEITEMPPDGESSHMKILL
jgi:hypothetical protein